MEVGKSGNVKMQNNFDEDSDITFERKLCAAIVNAHSHFSDIVVKKERKMYFAGPWFDYRARRLYKTCEDIVEICNAYSPYTVYFPKNESSATPKEAFNKNITQIKDADIVVALVSRKDVGTAWEIGMAYSLGKPIILLGYDRTTFLSHTNVMLAFTGKCITIRQFPLFLKEKDYVTVKIKNKWEGIE